MHWSGWMLAMLVLVTSGCPPGCGNPGDTSTSSSGAPGAIWRPTTVPFTDTCAGCTTVKRVEAAHLGSTVEIRTNPGIDDAVAQWGDCLQGIFDCVRTTGPESLRGCTASSSCPAACRDAFATRVAPLQGSVDEEKRIFREVFIAHGAVCRPERPVGVMP